jgi:NADP-dependent 3-hydroxy acid dehydrogenase YdfG
MSTRLSVFPLSISSRTPPSSTCKIDILVANAGVIPLLTVVTATARDWDEVMNVDGRGMFLTCPSMAAT